MSSELSLGLDPGLRPVLRRNLLARPGRSLLTMLAVCLGVAVMLGVQIDIATAGAEARAQAALRAGGSGLDVRSDASTGLSATDLAALASLSGVREVVPLYQKRVVAQPAAEGATPTTVTVVGLQGGAAALRPVLLASGRLPSASSRDEIAVDGGLLGALAPPGASLGLGGSVTLTTGTGPQAFRVVGITRAGGVAASFAQDAIFLPVAELQGQFGLGLHASLAALRLAPAGSAAQISEEVALRLGSGVTAFDPRAGGTDPLAQLTPLLLLVGVLSVVVGAGVSATTVSLAALERRRELGLLRAAGVPAAQVFRLLTLEALTLALAGAIAGVGAGIGLGAALQAAFVGGVSPAVPLQIDPVAALLAALAGTLAATAGAAIPALMAARLPILQCLNPDPAVNRERVHVAAVGAIPPLLALAAIASLNGPAAVAVGGLALLAATGLCLPLVVPPLTRLLARLAARALPEGEVAAASLARRRNRTALTLAGLTAALAASVGSSILVGGSLAAGDGWVDHLFIGGTLIRSPVTERPEIATQISAAAGVPVTTLRFLPGVVDDDVVELAVVSSRAQEQGGAFDLVSGVRSAAFSQLAAGTGVLAPLSLAQADDWQVGTILSVQGRGGTALLRVAGIVQHSFPAPDGREALLLGSTEATRLLGSTAQGFDDLEVLASTGQATIDQTASRYGLSAIPMAQIRSEVGAALDQTVGVLPAVSWISLAIALLAVINTLAVRARDGRRELAMLRAVGLSAGQARRYVLTQAGFVGVSAALLGCGAGCVLALPMLAASSSPGFTPAFDLSWPTVAAVAAGVVAGAVVAALLPARRAAQVDIVSAMRSA